MESELALIRPLQARSEELGLEHSPHSSTLQSIYGVPLPLNLDCRIFLSHSGKDKEFVRDLCDALCKRYHDNEVPFFDESSLPKAEAISMENIVEVARKSQLGVLVVTKDFFVQTVNPILELEALKLGKVQLLPLFFGMSVEEFKEKRRTCNWEEVWGKWATEQLDERNSWAIKKLGGRCNVKEVMETWRNLLKHVTEFSGLEYKMIAKSPQKYIEKIVDVVIGIVPPRISFSKDGVYGKDRLCEMVNGMYEKCEAKRFSSTDRRPCESASTSASSGLREGYTGCTTLDLVGIHGFSGLGKTTLCKCLCDFYFPKFNGKVCYINVGSLLSDQAPSQKHSVFSRLQQVASRFGIGNNNEFLYSEDIDQVENWFKKQLSSMKNPIFLAIDNIFPDRKSQEEAEFYLTCKFPKGSRIFITSRSESILTNLVNQHSCFSSVIEYMPGLEFEEARDIFVHEFPTLQNRGFLNLEDDVKEDVNGCVRMCTIHKTIYHPVMLQSLVGSIKWNRSTGNLDWKGRLAKYRSEGVIPKGNAGDKVFDMFDKAYVLLNEEAQRVFLELVFCYTAVYSYQMYEWIQRLFHYENEKMDEIILQLRDLCFLEKGECYIQILDLLLDFGKYKAKQGNPQRYVVWDDVHWWDDHMRSARTVCISRWGHDMRERSLLDLQGMEEVKVLHIVDNAGVQEVLLSGKTCAHLHSLIVRVPEGTSLVCTCNGDWSSLSAHTGGCLEWVQLEGEVCFRSSQFSARRLPMSPSNVFSCLLSILKITSAPVAMDLVSVLGGLRNLEVLNLSRLPGVQSINVATFANLKALDLCRMQKLELISGFENTSLENVKIYDCGKVRVLTIPAHLKTNFEVRSCGSLERISFCTMPSYCAGTHSSSRTRSGAVRIDWCPDIINISDLSQYIGGFAFGGVQYRYLDTEQNSYTRGIVLGSRAERFGDLLKLDDGVDYTICKAAILKVKLTGYKPAGLFARVKVIDLMEAQHVGLLISALFKAQPEDLQALSIRCKSGGDCGCDQNVPHFGPLPRPTSSSDEEVPSFRYSCPQVKELASLSQWQELECLDLSGCAIVEVWPDFAAMTLLKTLDLSFTSLKEWPIGVLRLPHLEWMDVRGCQRLPAEELMKVVTFELQPVKLGIVVCSIHSLVALRDDLKRKRRDRFAIANALDGVYAELIALFDRSSCWSLHEVLVVELVVAIMYDVWRFGEVDGGEDLAIREKMRRLLCSESFVSLPFCACSRSLLLSASSLPQLNTRRGSKWLICEQSFLSLPFRAGGEWERGLKHHARRGVGLMGIALVGGGSIACFDAPLKNDLRDSIIDFLKSFTQLESLYDMDSTLIPSFHHFTSPEHVDMFPLGVKEERVLRRRVREGQCRVARAAGFSDVDDEADSSDDEVGSGDTGGDRRKLPANFIVEMRHESPNFRFPDVVKWRYRDGADWRYRTYALARTA